MNKQKRREALYRALAGDKDGPQLTPAEKEFLDLNCHGWKHRLAAGEKVVLVVIEEQPHHGQTLENVRTMAESIGKKIDLHIIAITSEDAKL